MRVKCIRADGWLFEVGKSYDTYIPMHHAGRVDVCTGDRFNTTLVCGTEKWGEHKVYGAQEWITGDMYIFINEDK